VGAGVPVVATTVGGIPDQITDGVEGLLVEPRQPGALAARIESLLDGRLDPRRISEAAYRRAATEFSLEAMLAKTESIYDELLAHSPHRQHTARRPLDAVVSPERA
jgi:glycosyltransferase involved in cell wall biosynthesis